MSTPAIRVENLSKRYKIGARPTRYDTLRDHLVSGIQGSLRSTLGALPFAGSHNGASRLSILNSQPPDHLWALKDVSFEIEHGEAVGFIGRNGAGKSTLLKILSRVTEPTTGRAEIYGRVGSLLEIGTGFHPELTGRENIFLNGAILGMKKAEIERKFDEIVAFSEVEKFIDTPVKRYSSGMRVRLAFSVAAHLEPEILIVDEVLAVGDASFQKKCLGKMGDVTRQGRTVLFVSHNMGAVVRLCDHAHWLADGRLVESGPPGELVNRYQSHLVSLSNRWERDGVLKRDSAVLFMALEAKKNRSRSGSVFGGDEPITIEISYEVRQKLSDCQIGVRVYNSDGIVIFYTSDVDESGASGLPREPGSYRTSFTIPDNFLAPGTYMLHIAARSPRKAVYDVVEQALTFEVSASGALGSIDGRLGVITPLLHWNNI